MVEKLIWFIMGERFFSPMARTISPLIFAIALSVVLVALLMASGSDASKSGEKRALIVISEFNRTNEHEVSKAVAYYEFLVDEGFDEDNIKFLCMSDADVKDGNSTKDDVEDAFKDLVDDSSDQDDIRIYVSDNLHGTSSYKKYQFIDGNLSCSKVIGWIDDMEYSSLHYINLGNHSGLFGKELAGPKNVVISSMRANEDTIQDKFNITRGYMDPQADLNNDGIVSIKEAFYSEKKTLEGTDQTPIMW